MPESSKLHNPKVELQPKQIFWSCVRSGVFYYFALYKFHYQEKAKLSSLLIMTASLQDEETYAVTPAVSAKSFAEVPPCLSADRIPFSM